MHLICVHALLLFILMAYPNVLDAIAIDTLCANEHLHIHALLVSPLGKAMCIQ
jgi:hypothetical protein